MRAPLLFALAVLCASCQRREDMQRCPDYIDPEPFLEWLQERPQEWAAQQHVALFASQGLDWRMRRPQQLGDVFPYLIHVESMGGTRATISLAPIPMDLESPVRTTVILEVERQAQGLVLVRRSEVR